MENDGEPSNQGERGVDLQLKYKHSKWRWRWRERCSRRGMGRSGGVRTGCSGVGWRQS